MFRKSLIGAAVVMVCGLMLGCGDEDSDGKSGGEVSESRRNEIAAEFRKKNLSSKDFALAMVAATGTPKEIAAEIAKGVDRPNDLLFLAATYNEKPEVITALVNAGANPNAKDEDGNTPLQIAMQNNDFDIIAALVKVGADVNTRAEIRFDVDETPIFTPDMTVLHFAVLKNQNPEVIAALVKAGADVNAKDKEVFANYHERHSVTPLHFAARGNKNPEVIAALVKAGADVNAKAKEVFAVFANDYERHDYERHSVTPLHYAAENNQNPAVIAALVKAGADVSAKTDDGMTPLHSAAGENKNPEIITALIKAGADVSAKTDDGMTPLHSAAGENKNPEIITALIKAGADVSAKTDDGKTPLHSAAWNENPEIIAALVKAGADVNAKTEKGETPLHRAATWSQNSEVITALIKAGADVSAKANTVWYNKKDGNGSGKIGKDGGGYTPLHSAASGNERSEIITALVKAGADINAQGNDGNTPLKLAINYGNTAAEKALRDAGAKE